MRKVEGVNHGADKLPGDVAWQLRIRVKGDHVFHLCQACSFAGNKGEAIAWATEQKRIQVTKLAALTLVTHPNFFHRVPAARTMKQKEGAAILSAVFFIQLGNFFMGQAQQQRILRQRLLVRIPKIG